MTSARHALAQSAPPAGTVTPAAPGWLVDSPAVGTGLTARPCGDTLRPAEPPATAHPVALAMSGGGFRATLAALGFVRLLADTGLLSRLRYSSSVSGGSIANGCLATAWPALRQEGFTARAVDELVIAPVVDRISSRSLKRALLRGLWRTLGPTTRTDLLARRLDEWFFEKAELDRLDPQVRWIVNAANLTTGARFTFERDVYGDYTIGLVPTAGSGLRLSRAVSASAAVPGAFPPVVLDRRPFPCATHPPALLDGGTYDNTGLEAIDGDRYRHTLLCVLNAGGCCGPVCTGASPSSATWPGPTPCCTGRAPRCGPGKSSTASRRRGRRARTANCRAVPAAASSSSSPPTSRPTARTPCAAGARPSPNTPPSATGTWPSSRPSSTVSTRACAGPWSTAAGGSAARPWRRTTRSCCRPT
ncbi:patatin-like phospholipase family protein [Streptomyces sp. CA-179760]|uniref:patatin-like phospholipase family protein n=1 Tax=Streptomyces sp. CA-179760 TaxID=3240054 RepID=UPI003D89CAB3